MAADLSEAKKASAPGAKRRGGQYSRPAFSLSWLMPLRPGSELVPEKRMMILTADQLEMATHGSDVLMILDLSSAGVFPELEVSVRMLPDEARRIATLLVQTVGKAETERRRE